MLKIPVFLSSDNNYAPFVATTMASILMHTNEFIEFYILDCGISAKNKEKIKKENKFFKNFSIEFVEIDLDKDFGDFPELEHITKAMYARYMIADLKPEISRAIYSDIDVAFTGDIKHLWNENLDNYMLGAVPSQRGKLNNNYTDIKIKLNLADSHKFFMTGLLLIDCQRWREEHISEKLLKETLKMKNKITLPDQEIFNIVFNNGYKPLDTKYCVIYKIFKDCYTQEQINYLTKNQIIVHYPGGAEYKPWNNKELISAKYFWDTVSKTKFKKEIKEINKNFLKTSNSRRVNPMKTLLQKIFSVKNTENHKILTILWIKFKLKKKNKRNAYTQEIKKEIEVLHTEIKALHSLLNACVDITKIPPARGGLRKLQMADVLLLKIFDSICSKYNIGYWLDGGTLLGSVRHKGFIPWDDDIDIGMLREDYNKIINILQKELPEDLFEINEGKGFFRKVIRIIFKDSPIQIDIWPYDKYYKDKVSEEEMIKLKQNILFCYNKFWETFSHDKICVGECPFPREEISKFTEKYILNGNKPLEDKPIIFRGAEAWLGDRCVYDYEDIFPLKRTQFEGVNLLVPNKPEGFLDKYYGEYMQLPDFNMQILGHSNINEKLSSIDNKMKKLKEFYDKCKHK